jgi:methionyl-tRNA formyltransferase
MGTPDFSIPSVEAIYRSNNDLVGVVTQPDRIKGRGQKQVMTPIKQWAVANNIPVYQPEKAADEAFIQAIRLLDLDLVVTAAYGQILKQAFLDIPRYGCVNVHGSLLPKYRGASPMQQAILDDSSVTGITIMYMEKQMDAGDIVLQKEILIRADETCGELHDELSQLGGQCVEEILQIFKSTPVPNAIKQDENQATYCRKIDKNMGEIDWNTWSAKTIHLRVRALNPWPGAFTSYQNKRLKVHQTEVMEQRATGLPGSVEQADGKGLMIATVDQLIRLKIIQPEGKKIMTDSEFLRGYHVKTGEKLGGEK